MLTMTESHDPDRSARVNLAEVIDDLRNVRENLLEALPTLMQEASRDSAWPDTLALDVLRVMADSIGVLEASADLLETDRDEPPTDRDETQDRLGDLTRQTDEVLAEIHNQHRQGERPRWPSDRIEAMQAERVRALQYRRAVQCVRGWAAEALVDLVRVQRFMQGFEDADGDHVGPLARAMWTVASVADTAERLEWLHGADVSVACRRMEANGVEVDEGYGDPLNIPIDRPRPEEYVHVR
jgi:hypothetical protein